MSPDDTAASEPPPGPLLRVAVRAEAAEVELARARFLELSSRGFEERDLEDGLELAAYVSDPQPFLQLFPRVAVSPVAAGWEEAWRAFHQPVITGGVWIGPPWADAAHDRPSVVIDPGQAFGTGAHPTTRLCVELLAGCERGSLLDVGCGSGVLALAGVALGFSPVTAIDVDPVAVEAARANAVRNGLTIAVELRDADSGRLPAAHAAVVNVLLDPVERILQRLDATTAVTSGYLTGERPRHEGWAHVESRALDGWAADRFAR